MPKNFAEIDWYDLPRYYDIIFNLGTEEEADFLEGALRFHGRTRGRRVLEPACGTGRLVLEMARRGYDVTGFDLSQPMLDYAGEQLATKGLRARLAKADMSSFRFAGKFDLAHCVVSTFKYLLDESSARSHLECVSRALRPGGVYVLGFHLSDYADEACSHERWVARENGTEVTCNIHSWPANRRRRTETVRSRLVVRERGRESRSETVWQFRTYTARQVRSLLRSVPSLELAATYDMGFSLEEPRQLNDEQLDCVLVLRRRRGGAGSS